MDTVDYWEQREDGHIKAEEMSDEEVKDRMETIISTHMTRVRNEIESFYQRYADSEGLSYKEAKQLIDNLDMKEYSQLAEYYVRNKDDKDIAFSDKANKEMKIYNVTMKVNREQLILAKMAEHMKNMGAELESEMEDYLRESTIREFEYQAGLLGDIDLSEKQLKAIINSTHLSDKKIWSNLLWKNIGAVQTEVDTTIKDVLLRGRHPDDGVKRLRELTGRSEFEARRLLITETSRVQSEAELISLKEKEIKEFIFIAQIDKRTTKLCRSKHRKTFPVSEAKIGLNVPPLHQFCRSTVAPNITKETVTEEGGGIFNLFNDDDEEFEDDDISGDDPAEALLEDFEGVLDRIEEKTGKEYREEKVEEVEQVIDREKAKQEVIPNLNDDLKSKMEQKYIDQAEGYLSEAPEMAQKMWVKYSDRMRLNRTDETGAHFDPMQQNVNLHLENTFENDGSKKPKGDTFFHEFAHNIDDMALRDHKLGASGHFTEHFYSEKYGMTWEEVMQKEINGLVNAKHKEYQKMFKDGEIESAFSTKWKKANSYARMTREFRKMGAYETSAFSDIFSGVTKNKLSIYWGHSTSYWKERGNKVAFEAFANLYAAMVTSYETYQLAKETIPETVEVFEELVEYLGEDEQ